MASAEDELREELEGSIPEELREPREQRLVEADEGANPDDEADMVAEIADDEGDVTLSAEEAAIHVEDEAS